MLYSKYVKNSYKGRIAMFQAVVMKVLGIKDPYIKTERRAWSINIEHDKYRRICVKYSKLRGMCNIGYRFLLKNRKKVEKKLDCDTYFFLGFNEDWSDLNNIYIVPNKGWINEINMVTIYKDADSSKYDEFKVDVGPYQDAYRDLISHTKNSTVIDIDEIKEWLTLKNDK